VIFMSVFRTHLSSNVGVQPCVAVVVTNSHSVKTSNSTFKTGNNLMYREAQPIRDDGDIDLERRVKAYLADRKLLALRRVVVEAQQGVVRLTGRVWTFYEKQLIALVARRVAGVVQLIDDTQVAFSPSPALEGVSDWTRSDGQRGMGGPAILPRF
jgi:hypothetical protein